MAKIYKGIPYTGTLPATLTDTKAGNLHRYKIYGNTEQSGVPTPENPVEPAECGEKTENLVNESEMLMSKALSSINGIISSSDYSNTTPLIKISPNTNYTIKLTGEQITRNNDRACCFFDENMEFISGFAHAGRTNSVYIKTFTSVKNAEYVQFTVDKGVNTIMLVEGSTAPESYIPFGYKLPVLSGSTPVDIYIGDDTLSDAEYIDSGTGKIYRMVGGVLTPTDPPVPFPQIPTTANSTTISWAGEGLAPSQFDSIAEWVSAVPKIYTNGVWEDAQTYTYINGEWVADTQ